MSKGLLRPAGLALCLLIWLPQSHAQDGDNPVVGMGATRCDALLRMENKEALMAVSWVQGFLSGANIKRAADFGESLQLPNVEAIVAELERYCHQNPSKSVYRAATNHYKALEATARRMKMTTPSPLR